MTTLRRHALVFGLLGLILSCPLTFAFEVPLLEGRINDFAGMMARDTSSQLEETLRQFEEQTHHQIAVLTIPSLNGDVLEDFSIRVAEAWKIGHRGADDGVILLIVRDDRKIRIEVGYGLEGVLPDAIANRIIQDVIVPRFRDRDFAGGIESGVSAIIQSVRGETIAGISQTRVGSANSFLSTMSLLFAGAALFGLIVGFGQPSLVRAASSGGFVSAVIGVAALSTVGVFTWLLGICVGAIASISAMEFARRSWGRSWDVRAPRHDDFSPRDTFHRGYGGGGSSLVSSSGSAGSGSSGGFSGGGGGFGGGGASGGW